MTRSLTTIVSLLIFMSCSFNKSDGSVSANKSKLLELEGKWLEAEFSLDTAFLSSLMDSTFISISDEGIKSKNDDLISMYNNIKQRKLDSIVIDSFRLDSPVVNIYKSTAIVTFIVHTFGMNKNIPRERRTRFYDVWINRNGNWKAVASQGTSL